MKNSEKIIEYLQQGFLFHGSTNGQIEELEPRFAADDDKSKEFNNDNAIFATEYPESAILFGIINRSFLPEALQDLTWGVNWLDSGVVQAELPKAWLDELTNLKGYLYILPRESFKTKTPGGGQYKSYVAVKPISKIQVNFQDFFDLGGDILWMD